MRMKLKYVKLIGGNYYYQRAVPVSLVEQYGRKVIQIRLDGTLDEIKIQSEDLGRKHSAEFSAMRGGAKATPAPSMSILAREMLSVASWQIDLGPTGETAEGFTKEDLVHQAIETMAADGNLVARKALELNLAPDACTATEAVDTWLEWKGAEATADNEKYARLSVRYLTEVCGDKPISLYTRADAKAYVDYLLKDREVSTSTVRRNLNNIVSIFNRARSQKGIDMVNVFEKYELPRLKDTKTREPYTPDEMQKMIKGAMELQSHTALLVLLGINVGARIGELVGLAKGDFRLQDNIPHIIIEERPWRSLKTAASKRRVPLTGVSLQAAQMAVAKFDAEEDEPLFQQYWGTRSNINTRSASAGVNKLIKKYAPSKTSHSSRHRVVSDLTAAGCPLEIIHSIVGHTVNSVSARVYNKADIPLDQKLRWLEEIAV